MAAPTTTRMDDVAFEDLALDPEASLAANPGEVAELEASDRSASLRLDVDQHLGARLGAAGLVAVDAEARQGEVLVLLAVGLVGDHAMIPTAVGLPAELRAVGP